MLNTVRLLYSFTFSLPDNFNAVHLWKLVNSGDKTGQAIYRPIDNHIATIRCHTADKILLATNFNNQGPVVSKAFSLNGG